MAKIILGQRPKNFPGTVHFQMVDGSPGSMDVTYIYRTRSEFGKFADEVHADVKARADADMDRIQALVKEGKPVPEMTQAEILAHQDATNVGYIMGCIEGWGLDVPLTRAAVAQLADEVPAAIAAIISTYREASTEGRLGN